MKRFVLLLAVALLAAVPSVASAQLVQSPVPGNEEYLNFLSGSGFNGLYGSPSQVGPYSARFEYPTTASFSVVCVDYLSGHYAGDGWVLATELGSSQTDAGLTGRTRLNGVVGSLNRYTKAAYLSNLFGSWASYTGGGYTTNNSTTVVTTQQEVWSALHVAIWNFIYPPAPGAGPGTPNNLGLSGDFTALANTAVDINGWEAEGWYVLTPETAQGSNTVSDYRQEFLVKTVVPEPSTYVLLGTGLLLLLGFSRKRLSGSETEIA